MDPRRRLPSRIRTLRRRLPSRMDPTEEAPEEAPVAWTHGGGGSLPSHVPTEEAPVAWTTMVRWCHDFYSQKIEIWPIFRREIPALGWFSWPIPD